MGRRCFYNWNFKIVDDFVGREQGVIRCWVYEFELDFCSGECYIIEFEVVGFLYGVVGDGYMCDDGFVDVGLLDVYCSYVVLWNVVDQVSSDGEGFYCSGEIVIVVILVDEGFVNGDLVEEVIYVVIGFVVFENDDCFVCV